MDNEGGYFIGTANAVAKARGWFFGSFMDEPLLRSNLVEVAWQPIPNVVPHAKENHFHRESVEINVVVSGSLTVAINGTEYRLSRGEFYVVWPLTTVEVLSSDAEAELIVVRAPSITYDKYLVP
jgi:mannose-6-phosphate isomerase-like protein (cupin superfamily)